VQEQDGALSMHVQLQPCLNLCATDDRSISLLYGSASVELKANAYAYLKCGVLPDAEGVRSVLSNGLQDRQQSAHMKAAARCCSLPMNIGCDV
jgi:hypothetical protein